MPSFVMHKPNDRRNGPGWEPQMDLLAGVVLVGGPGLNPATHVSVSQGTMRLRLFGYWFARDWLQALPDAYDSAQQAGHLIDTGLVLDYQTSCLLWFRERVVRLQRPFLGDFTSSSSYVTLRDFVRALPGGPSWP